MFWALIKQGYEKDLSIVLFENVLSQYSLWNEFDLFLAWNLFWVKWISPTLEAGDAWFELNWASSSGSILLNLEKKFLILGFIFPKYCLAFWWLSNITKGSMILTPKQCKYTLTWNDSDGHIKEMVDVSKRKAIAIANTESDTNSLEFPYKFWWLVVNEI